MVGVGTRVQGVGMSDLGNQQKRHQSETHERDQPQGVCPVELSVARISLKSVQR
jgi:hypothetical protein